jgi:endonuclease YncB( thermonuclease family)
VFWSIVRTLVATILVLLGFGAAAHAAEAWTGACLPPASALVCNVSSGKVTYVGDGDTVRVDIAGDGGRASVPVRLTGINTTEQTVHSRIASLRRGECHSLEATARLDELLRANRYRVRLYALDPASASGRRLKRVLATRVRGRWRDVGRILVTEGHAVWLAGLREYAWNVDYARRAERAAARQLNIWNPTYCGVGPSDASPLKVTVNGSPRSVWDEWVRVRNLDPVNTVHLGGWTVRDSALNRYVFPDWATLPPGESLTVYVGEGTDTWIEFFWNRRRQLFDQMGQNSNGDGAYLVDPDGDIRAWMTYPCVSSCVDPYQGALNVTARPRGGEYVTISNVGSAAVDLDGYQLQSPPYSHAFGRDSLLQPGERMRVWTTGDPAEDTRLEKYWGESGAFLNDRGDRVLLSSLRGVVVDCYAYGTVAC